MVGENENVIYLDVDDDDIDDYEFENYIAIFATINFPSSIID